MICLIERSLFGLLAYQGRGYISSKTVLDGARSSQIAGGGTGSSDTLIFREYNVWFLRLYDLRWTRGSYRFQFPLQEIEFILFVVNNGLQGKGPKDCLQGDESAQSSFICWRPSWFFHELLKLMIFPF